MISIKKRISSAVKHSAGQLIAKEPNNAAAHYFLAMAVKTGKPNVSKADMQEVLINLIRSFQLLPNRQLLHDLAWASCWAGEFEYAEKTLLNAAAYEPDNLLLKLSATIGSPNPVPESRESIEAYMTRLIEKLKKFPVIDIGDEAKMHAWVTGLKTLAYPRLQWKYWGINTAPIKAEIGRIFKCSRQPQWQKSDDPIPKVGFYVTTNQENIFSKEMLGIVNHWDHKKLSLKIVCFPPSLPILKKNMPHADYLVLKSNPRETKNQVADYIQKALRLAQDHELREKVRARILERNHVLFENLEAVQEFQDCLLKLIENARN